jgi:hypothetical protein
MKPLSNRLAGIASIIFFPLFFFWRKARKNFVAVLLLLSVILASCFQHFYRTGTQNKVDAATIQKLMSKNKIFIIHFKDQLGELQNLTISNDKLEADLIDLPPEHLKYTNPNPDKANRVKKMDKANTLMEAHLYYPQDATTGQSHLSIPLAAFNRIDIYEFDEKTTTTNHVLSWIGIAVGIPAVTVGVAVIVVAATCNCPQVCINTNGEYQFVSGVYSGAVYSSLERTDYLPLPSLNTLDKTFKIKIRNVKDEEQFMNRVQLLEVSHPAGSTVLLDRHGKIFSYKQPIAPVADINIKSAGIKKQIALTDDDQYLFDSEKTENGLSSTVLIFNKPVGSKKAKLIVHAGNSLWSGYLYHSFAELFGTGYEKWKNEKDRSDPKEMEKWQTNQGLPMMVYIEKDGQWIFADYFAHTGNTASRDMIMELDLSGIRSDQVKIKLETVYQFWNLDFAGIDFSENDATTSNLLSPSKALRLDGEDQVKSLCRVDKDYTYLNPSEEINLEYEPVEENKNVNTSYFLVSTGYYHNLKKYEGAPKVATLSNFKNKNAFDDFSREKFNDLKKSLNGSQNK